MAIRDDKREAEEQEGKKVKVSEQPGPDFRVASDKESEEEHRFTTDSPRWGEPGSSREERGYPREGEPERHLNPRKK